MRFKKGEIIRIRDGVSMNLESGEKIKVGGLKAEVVHANPISSKIRFLNRKIHDRDEEGGIRRDLWFSNQMIKKEA